MHLFVMISLISLLFAASARADVISVPSGKAVSFHEMIWNVPGAGLTYRFRFLSEEIARADEVIDYEDVERDLAHLCQEYALPRIANTGPAPHQVVISVSNKITEFGVPATEATQFFEAYSVVDDTCIWEPF